MLSEALVPIYILVAIGFVLVKSGYLPREVIRPANLLVVKVFVPVLIFLALFRVSGNGHYNLKFIVGYGLASLMAMLLTLLVLRFGFAFDAAKSSLLSLAASGSNSIFIGFPLVLILFHDMAEMSLSWALIVENLLIIPLSLLLFDLFSGQEKRARQAIVNLVKNPILIAILAGIIAPTFIDQLWPPLERALDMMRSATSGFALILVGGMLARSKLGGQIGAVSFVAIGKLVLHPLATLLILLAFGFEGELLVIGVCYASVSVFGVYANFCEMADEGEFGASVFFLTTLLAPATIAIWLALANSL